MVTHIPSIDLRISSALIGTLKNLTPVAWYIAFAIAAPISSFTGSPRDLAPPKVNRALLSAQVYENAAPCSEYGQVESVVARCASDSFRLRFQSPP